MTTLTIEASLVSDYRREDDLEELWLELARDLIDHARITREWLVREARDCVATTGPVAVRRLRSASAWVDALRLRRAALSERRSRPPARSTETTRRAWQQWPRWFAPHPASVGQSRRRRAGRHKRARSPRGSSAVGCGTSHGSESSAWWPVLILNCSPEARGRGGRLGDSRRASSAMRHCARLSATA